MYVSRSITGYPTKTFLLPCYLYVARNEVLLEEEMELSTVVVKYSSHDMLAYSNQPDMSSVDRFHESSPNSNLCPVELLNRKLPPVIL